MLNCGSVLIIMIGTSRSLTKKELDFQEAIYYALQKLKILEEETQKLIPLAKKGLSEFLRSSQHPLFKMKENEKKLLENISIEREEMIKNINQLGKELSVLREKKLASSEEDWSPEEREIFEELKSSLESFQRLRPTLSDTKGKLISELCQGEEIIRLKAKNEFLETEITQLREEKKNLQNEITKINSENLEKMKKIESENEILKHELERSRKLNSDMNHTFSALQIPPRFSKSETNKFTVMLSTPKLRMKLIDFLSVSEVFRLFFCSQQINILIKNTPGLFGTIASSVVNDPSNINRFYPPKRIKDLVSSMKVELSQENTVKNICRRYLKYNYNVLPYIQSSIQQSLKEILAILKPLDDKLEPGKSAKMLSLFKAFSEKIDPSPQIDSFNVKFSHYLQGVQDANENFSLIDPPLFFKVVALPEPAKDTSPGEFVFNQNATYEKDASSGFRPLFQTLNEALGECLAETKIHELHAFSSRIVQEFCRILYYLKVTMTEFNMLTGLKSILISEINLQSEEIKELQRKLDKTDSLRAQIEDVNEMKGMFERVKKELLRDLLQLKESRVDLTMQLDKEKRERLRSEEEVKRVQNELEGVRTSLLSTEKRLNQNYSSSLLQKSEEIRKIISTVLDNGDAQ